MKKNLCLLMVAPMLLASGGQAATYAFTNLDGNSGAVAGGSIARASDNSGNPYIMTYTVTGIDFNEDSILDDEFVFTLTFSGTSGGDAADVDRGGNNANNGFGVAGDSVEVGEVLTVSASAGSWTGSGLAPTIMFTNFQAGDAIFGDSGAGGGHGVEEQISINGGAAQAFASNAQTFDLGNVATASFAAVAPTVSGTTSFRVRDIDLSYEIVAVPEPSSTALIGLGGLALIMRRRK